MAYETKYLSDAQMNIFAVMGKGWVFDRRDAWQLPDLRRHLECLGMSSEIVEDVKSMVQGGWLTELAQDIIQMTPLFRSEANRVFR